MKKRGRILKTPWAPKLIATLHPSQSSGQKTVPARTASTFLLTDLKLVASELSPRA